MSICTALSCQGAQIQAATVNYESLSISNGKNSSFFYQRMLYFLNSNKLLCRQCQLKVKVSAGSNQGNLEVVHQEVKQRGRPKKERIHDVSVPSEVPKVIKGRGRSKKNAVSSSTKANEDSTNMHAHHGQKDEQEPVPVRQTRQGHLFQYQDFMANLSFHQLQNESEVSQAVIKLIVEVSRNSIRSRGWFTVAMPGGSLVKVLTALTKETGIEWAKWHVFWVDERVVSLADDDSNFKLVMETFLSKTKVPKEQIHSIEYEDSAMIVARKYDNLLRSLVKKKVLKLDLSGSFPQFDLILLGIGPDGHIASLFPNSLALAEEREWIVPILHSPKPPPKRISMTLPIINAASNVCFIVVGHGKAEVIQRILERSALPGALPAQLVRPSTGMLHWFLDKEAAKNLSTSMWSDPKKFPAQNYSAAQMPQR